MGFFETAQLVSGRTGGQPPQSCTDQPFFQLNFLKLSNFSDYRSRSTNSASVQKLLAVLLEGLKNLNTLIIEDNDWDLCTPIDAVLALGSNLQRVDLRQQNYSFSVHQGAKIQVVSVAQLVQLRICCPNLESLCLNLYVLSREVSTKP